MVQPQLDEGLGALDVAGVVAHHHQVVVELLAPLVVELGQSELSILAAGPIRRQYYLDRVLGQSVVSQHPLDLLLQLPRRGRVQVVGEPSANHSSVFWLLSANQKSVLPPRQPLDDVQLAAGLGAGVAEELVLDHGALACVDIL